MKQIFKLPDLGEGLAEAILREWYVAEGDHVVVDQPLASMETDKALVDIPSPYAGTIIALNAKADQTIKTGAPLIEFALEQSDLSHDIEESSNTVVGSLSQQNIESSFENIIIDDDLLNRCTAEAWSFINNNQLEISILEKALANKPVITINDVKPFAQIDAAPLKAINGLDSIRQSMFNNISKAGKEVTQVTLYDDANISHWPDDCDFTANIMHCIVKAIETVPVINSIYNAKSNTLSTLTDINCGIAMDSEHGLFVPVIHNTEQLDAKQIREKINDYKAAVKSKQLKKECTLNPTILLSNFGMFGAKYATPMVMPPMMAIIGIGQSHFKPMALNKTQTFNAKVLPISLSVDHRFITGGEAAKFLAAFIEALTLIES